MTSKRGQTKPSHAVPPEVPSPAPASLVTPPATTANASRPATTKPWPSFVFKRVAPPAPVDPARFLDAAQAAFAVSNAHRSPHTEILLFLAERLAEPTSTGLPDPFAPALRVLAQTLYGPSDAPWEEATTAFRHRYLSSGSATGSKREADAAVRRWQALVNLEPEARTALHGWCLSQATGRGPDRACALVAAAAREPLWPTDPPRATCPRRAFQADGLIAGALLARKSGIVNDVPVRTAQAVWDGLFDGRLAASSRALAPLAQRFLAYLVTWIGVKETIPTPTHKVWADDLAEWAGLEPEPVRAAFAETNWMRSPIYLLLGQWVFLPDWRWSDFADPEALELPWFADPPAIGQSDGCPWLEVTLTRELLPYLRRLGLYLDQMPLAVGEG